MALDLLSLDTAFEGLPYSDTGPASDTSLDLAFEGQPFAPYGPAVISSTVTTSQAQRALSSSPVDLSVATSQAQGSAGAAGSGPNCTGATSQGQTTVAAVKAVTPWVIVQAKADLIDDPDGDGSTNFGFTGNTMAFGDVTEGNALVVFVFGRWRSNGSSITLTDSAGNSYTAGTLYVSDGGATTDIRRWAQAFYVNNIPAATGLQITFDVTSTGTIQDFPVNMHLAAFEVASDATIVPDAEKWHYTAVGSNSTTLTTGTFNTSASGAVFVAQVNASEDSIAASTNFEVDYTDLPRPGRLESTGFPDQSYGAAGYRITTGPLANEQVTFAGNNSTQRALLAVAFKDGEPAAPIEPVGNGATRQAQRTTAAAGFGSNAPATTRQGQRSVALAGVASMVSTSLAQAQRSSAIASAVFPGGVSTAQGQRSSAQSQVSAASSAVSAQAQQALGAAVLSLDLAVQTAQVQQGAAQLAGEIGSSVSTHSAQRAAGQISARYVLDVMTFQDQHVSAVANVSVQAQASTAQGQGAAGELGVSVEASATTRTRQRVRVQARGESTNAVETGQSQDVFGQLGLTSYLNVSTRQGQRAELLAGVAIDTTVATGQAQHIGDATILVVSVDLAVTTAQDRQHAGGSLATYQPRPGALTPSGKSVRTVLTGQAGAQPKLTATIRLRPAVGARTDLRPER